MCSDSNDSVLDVGSMYPDPLPRRNTFAPICLLMCDKNELSGPSSLSFKLNELGTFAKPTNTLSWT